VSAPVRDDAPVVHNGAPVFERSPKHPANTLHNGANLHQIDAQVEPLRSFKDLSSSPDWLAEADDLISNGVTKIHRDKAALVLAELAGGTAPSTVARKPGVGYATVSRIAETTRQGADCAN
jgi:hypothetical protein